MITRCRHCNKPLALNDTAWTCGPLFCSRECGINWAKTLYSPNEYASEEELLNKATGYFDDVAEEISREDYGATAERLRRYDKLDDITTVYEEIREGEVVIGRRNIGWYKGSSEVSSEDVVYIGMSVIFVE